MRRGRGWTCGRRKDFSRDGVSKAMYMPRLLATSLLRAEPCSFIALMATLSLKRFCCSRDAKNAPPTRLRALQEPTPMAARAGALIRRIHGDGSGTCFFPSMNQLFLKQLPSYLPFCDKYFSLFIFSSGEKGMAHTTGLYFLYASVFEWNRGIELIIIARS